MRKAFNYYIYSPCGNDTALVEGVDYTDNVKRLINDKIMNIHSNIEQVGFIATDKEPKLIMAGGEFCGNAARSAAYSYLRGREGKVNIKVCNDSRVIEVGIDSNKNVWSQMPLYAGKDIVTSIDNGIYKVKMDGITHIIVDVQETKKMLSENNYSREFIKEIALNIVTNYNIEGSSAIGVMFLEEKNEELKIHPVVWVRTIDTLFYETACGSGTTAVAILETINRSSSQQLEIIQPSGQIITANTIFNKGILTNAFISGKIKTDGILKRIEIDI